MRADARTTSIRPTREADTSDARRKRRRKRLLRAHVRPTNVLRDNPRLRRGNSPRLFGSSRRTMAEKPTRSALTSEKGRAYARRCEEKKKREKARERGAHIHTVPAGGSDFAHCHCNFLTGCSFRGVSHHRGITYRWLFVRMSPRVIICLVTRSVTAYLASFSISPPSPLSFSS